MGSLVFSPIQTFLINPTNVPVNNVTRQFDDPEVLNRLPHVFLVIGVILSVTQIIGLTLLRSKPKSNAKDNKIEILDESESSEYEIKDYCSGHKTWSIVSSYRLLPFMVDRTLQQRAAYTFNFFL
ncbi:hypothetical protein MS3_00003082 [Schistosoma haematobium]|uniref:Uncharacterized protein n=1 Tax=Schistosoma haematobium TaxID=6185 RepID=A0A922LNH2_SCHHA|nr:hypothetical protein MS3_00003082 [Schistosoma haematobium]KAH9590368.1 hypothetical protein MS3_00003082 [Schistosoma haematobium]